MLQNPVLVKNMKAAIDAGKAIHLMGLVGTGGVHSHADHWFGVLEMAKHLNKDQLKLYSLIWNRAVASQMASAVFDVTTLLIGAGDYQLRATGSVLKFEGFLKLSDKKDLLEDKDKTVPYLELKRL